MQSILSQIIAEIHAALSSLDNETKRIAIGRLQELAGQMVSLDGLHRMDGGSDTLEEFLTAWFSNMPLSRAVLIHHLILAELEELRFGGKG